MTSRSGTRGAVAVVLLAALLACKQGRSDSEKSASTPSAAGPAAPTPAAPAAPTETAAAAPAVDEKGIPAIPETHSNPPTSAEWSAAKEVNTQEVNSQAKDCFMKVVREWLKVHCEGEIKSISDKDGLPKSSADYYESIQNGKFADFVFRLKKGSTVQMRIHRDGNRASLFVSWPGGKDRPVNIALSQIKE